MPYGSPEPNFFDRFDKKEPSGLGGRNKAVLNLPPMQYPGPPLQFYMQPADAPPVVSSPQPFGLSDEEIMLLKGIRPHFGAERPTLSTFHTSNVLLNQSMTDGGAADDDPAFFDNVARLRNSNDMGPDVDFNVYGTPKYVTQQRNAELQRRSSNLKPQFPSSPTHNLGGPQLQRAPVPASYNNKQVRPGQNAGGGGGESVRNLIAPLPQQAVVSQALTLPKKPALLSTQEANEIQNQLYNLRRQDAELEAHYAQTASLAPVVRRGREPQWAPREGGGGGGQRSVQVISPTNVSPPRQQEMFLNDRCNYVVPTPLKGTAGLPASSILSGGPPGLLDDIFMKYTAIAQQTGHVSPPKKQATRKAKSKSGKNVSPQPFRCPR